MFGCEHHGIILWTNTTADGTCRMNEKKYVPPKETAKDLQHAAGRGLLGAIPFVGQSAIEVFNKVINPPIERRRDKWRASIGEALEEMERRQECVVDDLVNNDSFIDILMQASHVAVRTSHERKLDALRNAVQNSARPNAPDDSLQAMFVHFVDIYSPLHLELLNLLDDPQNWLQQHGIELKQKEFQTLAIFVHCIFRETNRSWDEPLSERVCQDLHNNGLLIASSLRKRVNRFPYSPEKAREEQPGYLFADELPSDTGLSFSGQPTAYRHWTTGLGRRFLAFIRSPFDEDSGIQKK